MKNIFQGNYSSRNNNRIKYIIIHYTEMFFDDALKRLCEKKSNVSAHYLIRDNGEIVQLVSDEHQAWHAGLSYWLGETSINNSSIGIELDNLGICDFPLKQIDQLIKLCTILMKKYKISSKNVIGHSDISPERKIDPGILFPWDTLAKHNIGIWPSQIPKYPVNNEILFNFGDKSEMISNIQSNFSNIGYNIKINGQFDLQTNYVIRAFQSHFNQDVIKKHGIEFYRNSESKYRWDKYSDLLLKSLSDMYYTHFEN